MSYDLGEFARQGLEELRTAVLHNVEAPPMEPPETGPMQAPVSAEFQMEAASYAEAPVQTQELGMER